MTSERMDISKADCISDRRLNPSVLREWDDQKMLCKLTIFNNLNPICEKGGMNLLDTARGLEDAYTMAKGAIKTSNCAP